jgi:hypothetical protein
MSASEVTIAGVTMSVEAARSVELAGVDVAADLARARAGLTSEELLAECLDGADEAHAEDWRDYVASIMAAR